MSNPASSPTPATPTPQETPASAPAPLSAEAALLLTQFKAVDPNRAGVGLDKIRMFYPRVGWDVIHARVQELEDANLLGHTPVMNQRGSVGYNLYTWKEA